MCYSLLETKLFIQNTFKSTLNLSQTALPSDETPFTEHRGPQSASEIEWGAGLTPAGRQAKVSEFSQRLFLLLESAEINRYGLRLPRSFCSWGMIDFCPLHTLHFYALLFFKESYYQWTSSVGFASRSCEWVVHNKRRYLSVMNCWGRNFKMYKFVPTS